MTATPDTIRIAHLTDVHLGPLTGFGVRHWNLKRALGYANWQRKRRALHRPEALAAIVGDLATQAIDHVAVTGDLVNIGLPDEHSAAARWLAALGPPDRVSVIPGNHDIYTRLARDIGIARWQPFMSSNAEGLAATSALPETTNLPSFPYVRRIGHVALVGLNSALPTPPGVAAGEIGRDQRARLGPLLDDLAKAGLFRLVMIHHPPLPGQCVPVRGLRDAEALAAILSRTGAELVIHGHNHVDMTAWGEWRTAGGVRRFPVVGAASASAAKSHGHEPLARYNIYEIARSGDGFTIERTIRGLADPAGTVVAIPAASLHPPVTSGRMH